MAYLEFFFGNFWHFCGLVIVLSLPVYAVIGRK